MVAGILRKMGVPMGRDVDRSNSEDIAFLDHRGRRDLFEDPARCQDKETYLRVVRDVVRKRNDEHDLWGWKDPLAPFYVNELASCLRNPIFILVTRDPGAVGQREQIEEGTREAQRILDHIDVALRAYRRCLDVIGFYKRPALLVSYERALRSPLPVGRAIAEMIGSDLPKGFDDWLECYVKADRLDGAVELSPAAASPSGAVFSTDAVQAVLAESEKLRSRGFHLQSSLSEQVEDIAAKLYASSITMLMSGRYAEGEARASNILGLFSDFYPELADGPIGLLASDAAASDRGLSYPDVVCGALYLVGLSNILSGNARNALLYFKISEIAMANRIRRHPSDAILSVANYASCVFYYALSAENMRRFDVVSFAVGILAGEADDDVSRRVPDLAHWSARAVDEISSVSARRRGADDEQALEAQEEIIVAEPSVRDP